MPKISAVLFDLDGTLRDSTKVIMPAARHALRTYGVENAEKRGLNQHIHSIRAVHGNIVPHVDYDKFLATYDAKMKELWHHMILYEGVEELVGKLYAGGYRLGIVSSARSAQRALDQFGINKYFEVVVGGNDTNEHKPSPEPVLLALKKLAIPASQAVMVGDLAADVIAARSASVASVVGITHGFGSRGVLEQAGADYIIDSLSELSATLDNIEES